MPVEKNKTVAYIFNADINLIITKHAWKQSVNSNYNYVITETFYVFHEEYTVFKR